MIDIFLKAKATCISISTTTEDSGIVLGQAVAKALGDKQGIARYGLPICPWTRRSPASRRRLGAALPRVEGGFHRSKIRDMDTELFRSGSGPSPSMPASRCMSRRSMA
jgi:imidazoleglycerol-phosphate dehydratase